MGGWTNDERGNVIHCDNFRVLSAALPDQSEWWRQYGEALERARDDWDRRLPTGRPR